MTLNNMRTGEPLAEGGYREKLQNSLNLMNWAIAKVPSAVVTGVFNNEPLAMLNVKRFKPSTHLNLQWSELYQRSQPGCDPYAAAVDNFLEQLRPYIEAPSPSKRWHAYQQVCYVIASIPERSSEWNVPEKMQIANPPERQAGIDRLKAIAQFCYEAQAISDKPINLDEDGKLIMKRDGKTPKHAAPYLSEEQQAALTLQEGEAPLNEIDIHNVKEFG
jgi:hypothetical protein